MEYFWSDPTGAVSHAYWNNSPWASEMLSPATVDPTVTPGSIVYLSAVSRDPNSWDLFFTQNGYLMPTYWYSSGSHPPARIGAQNVFPTYICAVSRDVGLLEVFYFGADWSIQHIYFDGQTWWGPYALMPAGSVSRASGLAAIAGASDTMDVFYVDPTQTLRQLTWTQYVGWITNQAPIANFVRGGYYTGASPLAAVSRDGFSKDVFFVNSNGNLVDYSAFPPGKATHVFNTGSVSYVDGNSDLGVVSRASNTMEVSFMDTYNAIKHAWWYDGSGWSGPDFILPGSGAPNGWGSVASVSRSSTTMSVPYMEAYSYSLREFWYDDSLGGWNLTTSIPASADPNWPSSSSYKLLSINPDNKFQKDWTNDIQGIAHSQYMWYITHGDPTSNALCKVPLDTPITNYSDWLSQYCLGLPNGNPDTHLGDLDYHAGRVFVPARDQTGAAFIWVFKDLDETHYSTANYSHELIKPISESNMSWLAIDPRSGILYGSVHDEFNYLTSYDIVYDQLGTVRDIKYRGQVPLSQWIIGSSGAAFSPNGHLYVVSNESPGNAGTYGNSYGGIYGVDVKTGNVQHLVVVGSSNFPQNWNGGHTDDEVEGADYIDLDTSPMGTGLSGKLHVQMCNNFVNSDDGFSLYNFGISSPDM